jgi:hypothetical protein
MNNGSPIRKDTIVPKKTPFALSLFQYKLRIVGTTTVAAIVLNIHHR